MTKCYKEIKDRIQQEDNLNKVYFLDKKGPGNGYHEYMVLNGRTGDILLTVPFQKGPRKESGSIPGVLDTDLLEIVRHRLNAFSKGPMANDDSGKALLCVEGALGFLRRRADERKKRGVLGTREK